MQEVDDTMQGSSPSRTSTTVAVALVVFLAASAGALSADTAGGAGGVVQVTDFEAAGSVAIQPDGKIVAAGGTRGGDFALARLRPNGSLDPTFSHDGKRTIDFGGLDGASGVALQRDGKIVVVGQTSTGEGDFALARLRPNGSLDPTFSGDGKKTTDFGGDPEIGGDHADDVAIQRDGKIVVVGSGRGFAVARYKPNGALDNSFSGDGKQVLDEGFQVATGVAIQTDGRIVAVGYGPPFALARFNPNGSLDSSFSRDGRQTTAFGGDFNGVASDVALQGDGRIVVAGQAATGPAPWGDFALARYKPNGSLDPTFSRDGKRTTDFGGYDGALGVAIGKKGKIVAVGFGRSGHPGDFALARYKPNGALDPAFSGDGKRTTDFGGDSDTAADVAIQGDGKIVAVGAGGPWPQDYFTLARYKPNGWLDPTFSGDGKQTAS
jgi:uncharacterized delta-60 repeat protein